MRYTKIRRTHEKAYLDRNDIANYVRRMSGDWIEQIDCVNIAKDKREYKYETIFYGNAEDLQEGGRFEFIKTASMLDRY